MRRLRYGIAAIVVLSSFSAFAQEPIIYPAKGQNEAQTEKDKAECGTWATKNTGIDPVAVAQAQASTPAPTGPQGERVKGAARGAAAGALIGAAAGDAGKGAAVGAGAGTVVGGARQRQAAQSQAGNVQAAQEKAKADLATYMRARSACLEGRGYTVK